jgi:two-component system chemotaxis sensor kinase CheA
MDAVRAAVGRLAGQVRVDSRPGAGTTIRFLLPFSVMMTPIMVVGAGGQSFGIPLDAVVETLRMAVDRISPIADAHVVVVRDRTIPLLSLARVLDVRQDDPAESETTVVITNVDGHYGALRVDRIGERMEVMMKPLEGLLAGMPALAGSTLLGDGSVLLILDLGALFQ